jgi:hypothetical protein
VKLLGEHEEESSLKITELEDLCKRNYEESPPRMVDDFDDLDDDLNEGRSDMDEWFPEDGSNVRN